MTIIDRYVVSEVHSRTDIKTYPHTDEGLERAKKDAKDFQSVRPEREYVIIETRVIFSAKD